MKALKKLNSVIGFLIILVVVLMCFIVIVKYKEVTACERSGGKMTKVGSTLFLTPSPVYVNDYECIYPDSNKKRGT